MAEKLPCFSLTLQCLPTGQHRGNHKQMGTPRHQCTFFIYYRTLCTERRERASRGKGQLLRPHATNKLDIITIRTHGSVNQESSCSDAEFQGDFQSCDRTKWEHLENVVRHKFEVFVEQLFWEIENHLRNMKKPWTLFCFPLRFIYCDVFT